MPTVLTHARSPDFTKTHFNLIGNDGGENQIFAAQSFAFTERERRSDEIARMTRIRFPIDVVVIHGANHVTIWKCCIDGVRFEAGHKRRRFAVTTANRAVMFQQNFRVLLLTATERTAYRVEPK